MLSNDACRLVPLGQLYGGKICAALDRQHPRDLFDIRLMLNRFGFNDEIKRGFIFLLSGGSRPINEVLLPNLLDQRVTMETQFVGMTKEDFSYSDFEEVRDLLIKTVHEKLTDDDRQFLLSIKRGEPDWSIYDFKQFPSIQWKLKNIMHLKERDPDKHEVLYNELKRKLYP